MESQEHTKGELVSKELQIRAKDNMLFVLFIYLFF